MSLQGRQGHEVVTKLRSGTPALTYNSGVLCFSSGDRLKVVPCTIFAVGLLLASRAVPSLAQIEGDHISASTLHPVPAVQDTETPQQHNARLAWWREARFGMFIHWGLYSIPAGTWNGKQIPDIGEWIMNNASIPVADYR